jgi:hypothetical protein
MIFYQNGTSSTAEFSSFFCLIAQIDHCYSGSDFLDWFWGKHLSSILKTYVDMIKLT